MGSASVRPDFLAASELGREDGWRLDHNRRPLQRSFPTKRVLGPCFSTGYESPRALEPVTPTGRLRRPVGVTGGLALPQPGVNAGPEPPAAEKGRERPSAWDETACQKLLPHTGPAVRADPLFTLGMDSIRTVGRRCESMPKVNNGCGVFRSLRAAPSMPLSSQLFQGIASGVLEI